MRVLSRFLAIFGLLLASPALALLPAADEAGEAPAEQVAPQPIEASQESGADERIAARIRGIFGELPAFSQVSVDVSEGVVVLSGPVPSAEDKARAEGIAARVSGVVTVENQLERDLSLDENLDTLGSLRDRVAEFSRMLPLIGLALAVALAIAAIGYILASFSWFWQRVAPNVFLAELIGSALRFVFAIAGIVVALDMLGAGALIGAVLGGAGIIGIALGFALRETVENYLASLMLSLRQPFRANDHVVIDDLEGRVIRLTSRATILMTLDGNHLRVPNAQVFKSVILNYTRNPQRRFDFELGIDADDDPNAARHLGRETLKALPFVLADPAPEARVTNVGDSNIVLQFLAWIDQGEADFFKARSRAIAAVKVALEDAGFALPEPIYRLRFDARTTPLPLENIAERPHQAEAQPGPAPRTIDAIATESSDDVAPGDEWARMVEDERASEPGATDLLDPSRPVE